MTKTLFRIAIPFLGMLLLAPALAEEISCESLKKYREGARAGHSAKLTFDSEHISALFVESFYASGKEGGAYFCTFEITRQEATSKWVSRGAQTSISVIDDDQESLVIIRKTADGYVIDPSRISRYYCGFGAEWPEHIKIETGRKKCTVSPNR